MSRVPLICHATPYIDLSVELLLLVQASYEFLEKNIFIRLTTRIHPELNHGDTLYHPSDLNNKPLLVVRNKCLFLENFLHDT
jgi:hypothetical protein